jgi:hypothetical protein
MEGSMEGAVEHWRRGYRPDGYLTTDYRIFLDYTDGLATKQHTNCGARLEWCMPIREMRGQKKPALA